MLSGAPLLLHSWSAMGLFAAYLTLGAGLCIAAVIAGEQP